MPPVPLHQGPGHPGIFQGGPPPPGQPVMMGQSGHINPHMGHPGLIPEHLGTPGCGGVPPGGWNLDYRVYELNKRLQQRPQDGDNLWWDSCIREFFDDSAILTVSFRQEDGLRRYTIGRTLIPRYFRSIFEGGVTELYYFLKFHREYFNQQLGVYTLDCEQTTIVSNFGEPLFLDVQIDGRLVLEMGCEDMRIRHWNFFIHQHRESVPKNIIAMNVAAMSQDQGLVEQMTKSVTFQGLSKNHLNYLRLCVILEPMQELMSRHKTYNVGPRECLTQTLFQKYRAMNPMPCPPGAANAPPPIMLPPEAETPRQPKRRKKRGSSSGNSTPTPAAASGKKSKNAVSPAPSGSQTFPLTSQVDVMVVGEPSLMGGEFGDEDERLISRLENTQFEPGSTGVLHQQNLPPGTPTAGHLSFDSNSSGGGAGGGSAASWGSIHGGPPMTGNGGSFLQGPSSYSMAPNSHDVKPCLPLIAGGGLNSGRPDSRSGGGDRKSAGKLQGDRPGSSPLTPTLHGGFHL